MQTRLARRLDDLDGRTLGFLDCGKRGGAPILKGIAERIGGAYTVEPIELKKTSAHSCASKRLVDEIASTCDALVYGVVN